MSQQDFVVLRSTLPIPPAAPYGYIFKSSDYDPGMEGAVLEEHSLSEAEHSDIKRNPRTKAIAPLMPMNLIKPTNSQPAQPAAATTSWGVDAVNAGQSAYEGKGVTVAVLDTGIDPNHAAFHGITLQRKNFTSEVDDDLDGHGTHCAGTIFGQDIGGQRIGVARGIEKALVGKVLGTGGGTSGKIAKAIQWAVAEGAHVISMSLGMDFPGFVKSLVDQGIHLEAATSMALTGYRDNINLFNALARTVRAQGPLGQGTVLVGASGNQSKRPQFTIAVEPPAAGIDIIAVGALQKGNGGLSVPYFSNTGVAVTAPGVDVVSANLGGGLISMDGTSMATPHAAGIAALWAEKLINANGNVDSDALTAQLVGRAETGPLKAGFRHEDVGTGIVQAP